LTTTVTNSVGATGLPDVGTTGSPCGGCWGGSAGTVTISLAAASSIRTSGVGAHGILAQSIGGGGGIAGLPTGTPSLIRLPYGTTTNGFAPGGGGGNIAIYSASPITTTGAFAYGIFAQSIGGGGGIFAQGCQVMAGMTSDISQYPLVFNGTAGQINIQQSAPVSAIGENSIGIFAQALGTLTTDSPSGGPTGMITVHVSAPIVGGSGAQGRGIVSDSQTGSSQIIIAPGGSVSALSGVAIESSRGNVLNYGTVTGSYTLGNGGIFYNYAAQNAGASLVGGLLVNEGTLFVASHAPYGVSRVSGDFVQTQAGRMVIEVDFASRRADMLEIQGVAQLDGRVRPLIASVLPNQPLPFLTVAGSASGVLAAENSTLFGYGISRSGGSYAIAATSADFTPPGFGLENSRAAVAGHMQAAWDAGGSPALAPLFALLGNTADAGGPTAYSAALKQISPDSSFAPGSRLAASAQNFANTAMSCPEFAGATAILVEGECAWGRVTARSATGESTNSLSSFRINTNTWQVGGQKQIGENWFLGGSLAYESGRLSTSDRGISGRGESGYGAVTLKYQTGPWLFGLAGFGGGGQYENRRLITLPGFGSVAAGSPDLTAMGVMLRGAFTVGSEALYVRPTLSLGAVHARSGAYRETGAGALNLEVSSNSSDIASLTPSVELGGRVGLENGMVLRLFASAGVSFLNQGHWDQDSRLTSAPQAAGLFRTSVRQDRTVGRVTAGAQLYSEGSLDLRVQYEGEYGQTVTGHGGSLVLALRF
jgi:uncharacterized protein with beta-barrel porin domain